MGDTIPRALILAARRVESKLRQAGLSKRARTISAGPEIEGVCREWYLFSCLGFHLAMPIFNRYHGSTPTAVLSRTHADRLFPPGFRWFELASCGLMSASPLASPATSKSPA